MYEVLRERSQRSQRSRARNGLEAVDDKLEAPSWRTSSYLRSGLFEGEGAWLVACYLHFHVVLGTAKVRALIRAEHAENPVVIWAGNCSSSAGVGLGRRVCLCGWRGVGRLFLAR